MFFNIFKNLIKQEEKKYHGLIEFFFVSFPLGYAIVFIERDDQEYSQTSTHN